MSQSDYIQYKKTGVQIQKYAGQYPVLPYRLYNAFTSYNVETTTPNNSINYGKQTIPTNVIQIFSMKIGNAVSCPTFACSGGVNTVTGLVKNTICNFSNDS